MKLNHNLVSRVEGSNISLMRKQLGEEGPTNRVLYRMKLHGQISQTQYLTMKLPPLQLPIHL